jgi:hypothetical protein
MLGAVPPPLVRSFRPGTPHLEGRSAAPGAISRFAPEPGSPTGPAWSQNRRAPRRRPGLAVQVEGRLRSHSTLHSRRFLLFRRRPVQVLDASGVADSPAVCSARPPALNLLILVRIPPKSSPRPFYLAPRRDLVTMFVPFTLHPTTNLQVPIVRLSVLAT